MGGIIILCGPIIHRFDKKELKLVEKRMSERKNKFDNYKLPTKLSDKILNANYRHFVEHNFDALYYNIYVNFNNIFSKEERDSNTTKFALITISTGFILQIIGNFMK